MNNKILLLPLVIFPLSAGAAQTVKCYLEGQKGLHQVIIATPNQAKSKPAPSLDELSRELRKRYQSDRKTLKKLGTISTFECVAFEDEFSLDAANIAFKELNY